MTMLDGTETVTCFCTQSLICGANFGDLSGLRKIEWWWCSCLFPMAASDHSGANQMWCLLPEMSITLQLRPTPNYGPGRSSTMTSAVVEGSSGECGRVRVCLGGRVDRGGRERGFRRDCRMLNVKSSLLSMCTKELLGWVIAALMELETIKEICCSPDELCPLRLKSSTWSTIRIWSLHAPWLGSRQVWLRYHMSAILPYLQLYARAEEPAEEPVIETN